MKKALALLITVLITFLWIITLTGVGDIGPIQNRMKLGLDLSGGVYVVMQAQTDATGEELQKLMKQTQLVIEERVNEMGLSEPVVTIEGNDRIRVELPGAEDAAEAIETIGQTAQLQFFLADGSFVLDGSQVQDAGVAIDQERGGWQVTLRFDPSGAQAFEEATRTAASGRVQPTIEGASAKSIVIVLDGNIISAPVAEETISGGKAVINGSFTEDDAIRLALQIRAGALPIELMEVEASEQGATLGINALKMSIIAGIIGVALIFLLMLIMYRIMGLAANLALLLYIPMVLWIMNLMGSVLTLPGIAGTILAIGMAVDANVIIFSRVREEIINGKSPRVAVNSGFKRAMTTVIDSQITTMIAALVLYQLGSGPVKGFAMTLMIGIVVSIFTAAVVSQLFLLLMAESKTFGQKKFYGVKGNNETNFRFKREFSFIKHKKKFYLIAVAVIVVGLGVGFIRGFNFGIDFTGGTMLQMNMGRQVAVSEVQKAIQAHDLDADIVHAGEGNSQIIIRTTQALNSDAREALLSDLFGAFDLNDSSVMTFEQFGPSIGELLTRNAIRAVLLASLGMLIYLIIRFEWKFGVSAIVGVFHDVLILITFYGLFSIPINNPFIAGLLTVVGYSINDTIVIFDRIRENMRLMKKSRLEELIDKSINQTIVRSLMTSLTTILAIIPLFILGGETIRQFTLPLIVGIAAGAASSIFICSPIYYDISTLLNKPKYQRKTPKKEKKSGGRSGGEGAVV